VIAEKDLELRGPGELLGTKQTGDLGFRVAKLERDDHLLNQAHYVAQQIMQKHPQLVEPLLKRWLLRHLAMLMSRFSQLLQPLLSCSLCQSDRATQASVCQDCWQQLPWLKQTIYRQEIPIQVAAYYQYPLDRMIQQFKYEQQLHYLPLFSHMLNQLKFPKVQAIVPMPISQQRLLNGVITKLYCWQNI